MFPELKIIGPLRILLFLLVALLVALRPFADDEIVYHGWAMVPTLLAPAVAPIVFFVLLLELMMVRLFYASAEGKVRADYGRIFRLDLIVFAGFGAAWGSYFWALLSS